MRRRRKKQAGQAAVLAVIGLIILAIGMYTSYNLSRTVYEKIQLQNAADATAFSIATHEARTFNFIAFANRAQVANYVQMLEAQSMLSNATYFEGVLGYASDWFMSFGRMLQTIGFWNSGIKAFGKAMEKIGETIRDTALRMQTMRVDLMEEFSTKFVRLMTIKNHMLFGVSAMIALSTTLQVATGGQEIAQKNDPGARYTWGSWLLSVINVASYATAFDSASFGMMAGDGEKENAKRLMSEIVHASRYGSPNPGEQFVIARSPLDSLTTLLTGLTSSVSGDYGSKARKHQRKANDFLDKLLGKGFVGTSKLLTAKGSGLPELKDTGRHGPDRSDLVLGEWLVAKDQATSGLLKKLEDVGFASVISGVEDFRHCRYEKPDDYGRGGRHYLWRPAAMLANPVNHGFERCKEPNPRHGTDHTWKSAFPGLLKGGIANYLKFAPEKSGFSAGKTSFNQPDVWIMLNKKPSHMALGGTGDLNFEFREGPGRTVGLDARIGKDVRGSVGEFFFPDGINVMARAQVYYHRPGAWQEPPNFFNPFWGARLAPKNVAIKRLMGELGAGATLSQIVADNVLMH